MNPVSVEISIVVLIGVRVTHELIAAIQLTIVNERLTEGRNEWIINPSVAPEKNNGIIKPPLHPDVTVNAIANNLNNRIALSNSSVKFPSSNSFI